MKNKFTWLLFLLLTVTAGIRAQLTAPNLIISEIRPHGVAYGYVELTNVGSTDINTLGFSLKVTNEDYGNQYNNRLYYFNQPLPEKVIQPGQTFTIATKWGAWTTTDFDSAYQAMGPNWVRRTCPAFLDADFLVGRNDMANGKIQMDIWAYNRSVILEYKSGNDSVLVDLVHASASDPHDFSTVVGYVDIYQGQEQYASVAGVPWVWGPHADHPERPGYIMVRKNTVTQGSMNWDNSRGTDASNSEWMLLPTADRGFEIWPYYDIFAGNPYSHDNILDRLFGFEWSKHYTTFGKNGSGTIDATTVKSDVITIDFANNKMTVPWGIEKFLIAKYIDFGDNMGWKYVNKSERDPTYPGIVTGDKLQVFAFGASRQVAEFELIAGAANDDTKATVLALKNVVKVTYPGFYAQEVPDTIFASGIRGGRPNFLPFGWRADTLFKYTEAAEGATKEIVWDGGKARADLKWGDKLKITNGEATKEYFLAVAKVPVLNTNCFLNAIRWPDIPTTVRNTPAWNGLDVIPDFNTNLYNYIVKLPATVKDVPALTATPVDLNASVEIVPAASLVGLDAERTATVTVTAEDGVLTQVYTVRFDIQKPSSLVQPVAADPLFTEFDNNIMLYDNFLEITNPGTTPVNLSNYLIVNSAGGTAPGNIIKGFVGSAREMFQRMYVPGYVYVEGDEWTAKPGFVKPDFQVNPVLGPGESFVLSRRVNGEWVNEWDAAGGYASWSTLRLNYLIDVSWCNPNQIAMIKNNPEHYNATADMVWYEGGWGWYAPVGLLRENDFQSLYKIKNDSITRGLKAIGDPADFELIDIFGTYDGKPVCPYPPGYREQWPGRPPYPLKDYVPISTKRKPGIWKGNPNPGGSFGATAEASEWTMTTVYDLIDKGVTNDLVTGNIPVLAFGLKSHDFAPVTDNSSTILSKVYKVSDGYTSPQTITGVVTGTTVADFKTNIIKKNAGQALEVVGKNNAALVVTLDTLKVTSMDETNITKYVLTVSDVGLSDDATLVAKTGSGLTVEVSGSDGTVSGILLGIPLDQFLAQVIKPANSTLKVLDVTGNLVPIQVPTADGNYAKVKVSDEFVIEVTSENSMNKITYQLRFAGVSDNTAILLSNVYAVDQDRDMISLLPVGISVPTFMGNVMVNSGATVKILDKAGAERTMGVIAVDDIVMVTSPDETVARAYFLSFLIEGFGNEAYVTSRLLYVDQLALTIAGVPYRTDVSTFLSVMVTPAEAASMVLLDAGNNVVTSGNVQTGYKLQVTSGDNTKTVVYSISVLVNVDNIGMDLVKVYPNPATDMIHIEGMRENCKVIVTSILGNTVKIVDSSEINNATISVKELPAGIYLLRITGNEYKSLPVRFVKL